MWHLSDAWSRRGEPNVVLVHYDDLSADLDGQMRRIAGRLGIAVPEALAGPGRRGHVRADARQRGHLVSAARILKSSAAFFRRGTSGAGREILAGRNSLITRSASPSWRRRICSAGCTPRVITPTQTQASQRGRSGQVQPGSLSEATSASANRQAWTSNVRRQTTPAPGGVTDKGTKGKRARVVPVISEIRPLVDKRLSSSVTTRCAPVNRGGHDTQTGMVKDAAFAGSQASRAGWWSSSNHQRVQSTAFSNGQGK